MPPCLSLAAAVVAGAFVVAEGAFVVDAGALVVEVIPDVVVAGELLQAANSVLRSKMNINKVNSILVNSKTSLLNILFAFSLESHFL